MSAERIICDANDTLSFLNFNFFFYFLQDKQVTPSSCLYRASVAIKTLSYPTDAQIYNS